MASGAHPTWLADSKYCHPAAYPSDGEPTMGLARNRYTEQFLDPCEWHVIPHILRVACVEDDTISSNEKIGWHAQEVAPRLLGQLKTLRCRRSDHLLRR